MPIVIKEIRVNTVVEKRIIQSTEVPDEVYRRIKQEILEELEESNVEHRQEKKRNDR